jgi:isopenicillin-N N-acyltransferase-like protein
MVKVRGGHRQIGQQIGESCRDLVRHGIETGHVLLENAYSQLQLSWDGAKIQARKYMPFAQERYPQYVEEIVGMAEGAGVSFDDLAVLNAMEAVTSDALHLTKCTSLGVSPEHTAGGHVLAAHNEDWLPEDEPDVFIVHAEPDDEPPWIAMTYGGLLPNIGLNAAGLAQCCDSVYPSDCRIGIPRVMLSRAVLGSRSISQAFQHMLVPLRAAGYNHLLIHESGELYNIEVSARSFAVLYSDEGRIVHTNHYLDPTMRVVESNSDELIHTRVRYGRALHLLRQTDQHTLLTLQSILKDHVNYPDSICNHSIFDLDPLDREKTITSLVMDLTARQLSVAWGNPCKNNYHTFLLDA